MRHLAERWLVSSPEIRQSIRILFDETVASLPDEEAIHIAEDWQHYGLFTAWVRSENANCVYLVPSLQPDAEKESITAALALFICGSIASNKYSLLSVKSVIFHLKFFFMSDNPQRADGYFEICFTLST